MHEIIVAEQGHKVSDIIRHLHEIQGELRDPQVRRSRKVSRAQQSIEGAIGYLGDALAALDMEVDE